MILLQSPSIAASVFYHRHEMRHCSLHDVLQTYLAFLEPFHGLKRHIEQTGDAQVGPAHDKNCWHFRLLQLCRIAAIS